MMTELLVSLAAVALASWLAYVAGKKTEQNKHTEDMIDAITNAKKARAKLSNPDYVEWLRRKRNQ